MSLLLKIFYLICGVCGLVVVLGQAQSDTFFSESRLLHRSLDSHREALRTNTTIGNILTDTP